MYIDIWNFEAVPHASNKVIYDRVKKGTVKNNNFEIPDAFLFLLPLHEEFEEPEILK